MNDKKLLDLAGKAASEALHAGAKEARVRVRRSREVSVEWRDGKLDRIQESTTQAMNIDLYVDGRYSGNSTSDLREAAVADYVREMVAATRYLAEDPHRHLPDPSRYRGLTTADLQLFDPTVTRITPEDRLAIARALETATRDHGGSAEINSVNASVSDETTYGACVATNGFQGEEESTSTSRFVEVSITEEGGRKPQAWEYGVGRFMSDLPVVEAVGAGAMRRALDQVGSRQIPTGRYDVVIENRAVPVFSQHLFRAFYGWRLQQKQSFLEGRLGERIAAENLTVTSDPHVVRGLGSTAWDREGMATRPRHLIERGVVKSYFLDTYYASKLGMEPTSGGEGNLAWEPGSRDAAAMIADLEKGLYVTRFLGGNSNSATGDFSLGIKGFLVERGAIVHPVSEMNIAGNHLESWKRLVEVGNDPWTSSSNRSPSLRFRDVQVSGS